MDLALVRILFFLTTRTTRGCTKEISPCNYKLLQQDISDGPLYLIFRSFSEFSSDSPTIRGNACRASEGMADLENMVCVRRVGAAENGPNRILQALSSILALVRR